MESRIRLRQIVDDEQHIIQDDGQMWINRGGQWENVTVCPEALDTLLTLMLG